MGRLFAVVNGTLQCRCRIRTTSLASKQCQGVNAENTADGTGHIFYISQIVVSYGMAHIILMSKQYLITFGQSLQICIQCLCAIAGIRICHGQGFICCFWFCLCSVCIRCCGNCHKITTGILLGKYQIIQINIPCKGTVGSDKSDCQIIHWCGRWRKS